MAIRSWWMFAIVVAVIAAAPTLSAKHVPSIFSAGGCNAWDGELTIVEVDNRPIRNESDLRAALSELQPGGPMYLTIVQASPTASGRTIKVAFRVGTADRGDGSGSSGGPGQNTPQREDYYELISGCVNCTIPGIELGGVRVRVLVSEDDSVAPPVKRGLFTITTPTRNSYAERFGMRPEDQIVRIGGKPVSGMTLMEAINRLQGPKGTDVTLTMARTEGPEKSFTVTLPRW